MTLAYRLLPLRRLWWFLTDWKTFCTFTWPCPHCQVPISLETRGFIPVGFVLKDDFHNSACRFNQGFRMPWRCHPEWWHCQTCLQHAGWLLGFTFRARWDFRLQWNWDIEK